MLRDRGERAGSPATPSRRDRASVPGHRNPTRLRRVRHRTARPRLTSLLDRRRRAQGERRALPLRVAVRARPDGAARRHGPARALQRLAARALYERKPLARLRLAEDRLEGFRDVDLDDPVDDRNRVGIDRLERRQRQRPAASEVEGGAVPRTDDAALVLLPDAFAERTVVVRATVFEGVELAVAVVDPDRRPARGDELHGAGAELGERCDVEEHGRSVEPKFVREALPLLGERRALRLVQGHLQHPEPEDRALQTDRRQRDPDLFEQLFLRQRRNVSGLPPDHELGEHRGRGLRDRATAALETDLLDRLAVGGELDRDRHLVAAERVQALSLRVGVVDQPMAARALVVIQDDLPIHLVEFAAAHANVSFTFRIPAIRRSTSSGTE